jgi:hypothetical protein
MGGWEEIRRCAQAGGNQKGRAHEGRDPQVLSCMYHFIVGNFGTVAIIDPYVCWLLIK